MRVQNVMGRYLLRIPYYSRPYSQECTILPETYTTGTCYYLSPFIGIHFLQMHDNAHLQYCNDGLQTTYVWFMYMCWKCSTKTLASTLLNTFETASRRLFGHLLSHLILSTNWKLQWLRYGIKYPNIPYRILYWIYLDGSRRSKMWCALLVVHTGDWPDTSWLGRCSPIII